MATTIYTYGTLSFPELFREVTGRRFASEVAWLSGYERFRVRGEVYPGLLRTGRGSTRGRVYFDVDPATVALLDRFEGPLYERRSVAVDVLGRGTCEAESWIVPAERAAALERKPWDPVLFRRRDLAAFRRVCRSFRAGRRRSAETPKKTA